MKLTVTTLLLILLACSLISQAQDGKTLYPMKQYEKWGYIDKQGNWVIEPNYRYAGHFNFNRALVNKSGNNWQVIKPDGSLLLDSPIKSSDYLFSDLEYGYSKTLGLDEIIPSFQAGKLAAQPDLSSGTQWIDTTGAVVLEKDGEGYNYFCNRARLGNNQFIDDKGEVIFEDSADLSTAHFFNNRGVISIHKGLDDYDYGFIDKQGKVIVAPQYEKIGRFSEGLAMYAKRFESSQSSYKLKAGFMDTQGNVVIKPQYRWAKNFSEGLAPVMINYEWGYINRSGEVVIEPQYQEAEPFSDGYAIVKDLDGSFYINQQGEAINRENIKGASMLFPFYEGLALVEFGLGGDVNRGKRNKRRILSDNNHYYCYIDTTGAIAYKQTRAEIKWLKAKRDSIDRNSFWLTNRIRAKGNNKIDRLEKKSLKKFFKNTKDYKVYGDSTRKNYLEFAIRDKLFKIYFEDVLIEQTGEATYRLIFPGFGTGEEYQDFLEARKRQLIPYERKLKFALSKIELKLSPNAQNTNDQLQFLTYELNYLDRYAILPTKPHDIPSKSFTDRSLKMEQTQSGMKISFKSEHPLTGDYLKGEVLTNQVFNLTQDQPQSIDSADINAEEEKVRYIHMRYLVDQNQLQIDHDIAIKGDKITYPGKGRQTIISGEGDTKIVYDFEEFGKERVIVKQYEINKELPSIESRIFASPYRKNLSRISEEQLSKDNLTAMFVSKNLVPHARLPDVAFEPPYRSEVDIRYESQNVSPLNFEEIPADINQDVGMPNAVAWYYTTGTNKFSDQVIKTDTGHWLKRYNRADPEIQREVINQKLRKNTTDSQYKAVMALAKQSIAKMIQMKQGKISKEAMNRWYRQKAAILNLNVDFEENQKSPFSAVFNQFNMTKREWIGGESIERIAALNASKETKAVMRIYKKFNKYLGRSGRKLYNFDFIKKAVKTICRFYQIPEAEGESINELVEHFQKQLMQKYGILVTAKAIALHDYYYGHVMGKIKLDEAGFPVKQVIEYGSPRQPSTYTKGTVTFRDGNMRLKASNEKQGEDKFNLQIPENILHAYQFLPAVSTLPLDSGYKTTLYLTGLVYDHRTKTVNEYPGKFGKTNNKSANTVTTGIKITPAFVQCDLEVLKPLTITHHKAEKAVYKVRTQLKGETKLLPLIELSLKSETRGSKSGNQFALYVSKNNPHHVLRIKFEDKTYNTRVLDMN